MDLAEAVTELYAAPLPDFVPTRTRLAAAAKDGDDPALAREIRALRKPTVTAWLLNQLTRQRPEVLEVVQHVGHRMRLATAAGDSATLRSLRPDRDSAISGVVAAAAELAEEEGRALTGSAEDEVRGTVVAALASEESSEAWGSGALLRALSYAGFGEVTLDDAVAVRAAAAPAAPETEPGPAPDRRPPPSVSSTPSREARLAVDEAERELTAARLRADEAAAALDAARQRAKDLRALLATARDEVRAAEAETKSASTEVETAATTLEEARARLDES